MIWTVIYRDDASGRQGTLELEAANRGDVLSQMRARKFRALNIVEGKLVEGKPTKGKSRPRLPGLWRRLLFWVVFLLVVGGAAWWTLKDSAMVQEALGSKPETPPPGSVTIQPSGVGKVSEGQAPSEPESSVKIKVVGKASDAKGKPLRPQGEK